LVTQQVNPHITDFRIKKLPYDYSFHAGLVFIGKYLKPVNVNALIDPKFPVRAGVANSDILKSYLALLCMGKSVCDAIESFRTNAFSSARWAWRQFHRARPCAKAWTPTLLPGLSWRPG
jgi:hypothetical protein